MTRMRAYKLRSRRRSAEVLALNRATAILGDSDNASDLVDFVDSAGSLEFEAMKVVFRSRLHHIVAPQIIPSRLS